MTPRTEPNIFSYANKELSQDAMICWLVACVNHRDDALSRCGKAFVRALFRAGVSERAKQVPVVSPRDHRAQHDGPGTIEGLLDGPSKQYGHIDVYFRARVDGKTVSFLIEDKTESSPHDNQLTKYRKLIADDTIREDWIKPVYFKTGYVFEEEARYVESRKYSLFTLSMLAEVLRRQIVAIRRSDLLKQYWEYVRTKQKEEERALSVLFDRGTKHEGVEFPEQRSEGESTLTFLNDGRTQYEFMLRLREQLVAEADWVDLLDHKMAWESPQPSASYGLVPHRWSRQPVKKQAWTEILHGASVAGAPWSQLWFCKRLFWRIDPDRPLRLMLNSEGMGRQLWEEYRRHFGHAIAQCNMREGDVGFRFGGECTVGSIRLDCQEQTPVRVIERLPALQMEFLRRIPPLA